MCLRPVKLLKLSDKGEWITSTRQPHTIELDLMKNKNRMFAQNKTIRSCL